MKQCGWINIYKGKKTHPGHTIFRSQDEGVSVPCANKDAYVDTIFIEWNEPDAKRSPHEPG